MSGKLADFILFQVAWFACVLGAAHGRAALGISIALACVAWHLLTVADSLRQLLLLLVVGLLGTVVDALLMRLGATSYGAAVGPWPDFLAPAWITTLWIAFATLLRQTLSWLHGRPLLAALLGLVGGPLSSLAGVRSGALGWHAEPTFSPLVLGLSWALMTPLLIWLAQQRPFAGQPKSDCETRRCAPETS